MYKKLSIFTMALFAAMCVSSQEIIVQPTINPDDGNGENPRAPIPMPVLYLDGHTLTAGSYTLGSTIQLLDEDGTVVFSTFIYIEGDIELPTTLSGTYTIRVLRGSQTFEGEITL